MAYPINRKPLLSNIASDSESEDIETEIDDASVSIPDKKPFFKPQPADRYHLAYIVFYLLGINTLIPWSFFITADDYWMFKFRQIHPNNSGTNNYTHTEILESKTDLQVSFTSYLNVSSALPNMLFLIINTFLSKRLSQKFRMISSQLLIFILFIMTTIFVKINTDEWQNTFLIITLSTVAIVNALSAIFGGTLMGIVGRFSPRYITAMSGGQALGGIFTALTEICSLWIGASPVEFFKHHMIQKPREEPNFSVNAEISFIDEPKISYRRIFKRILPYGLTMFSVFFVTMAVYPGVTVLIESQGFGQGHAWNDVYFVPVVTYLTFSCGDYVGRLLSGILFVVESQDKEVASTMMGAFLGLGITTGSALSIALIKYL
ncbi:hypothetical protein G9C98_005963 [Cotesia typhae]|uniref:Equilibrative nucleoside transporter 3 n=1 Tax=Cotesia typhae TaxID=2053667 RepID=A0A8J5QWQ2_9HYME|nr:hypothetical protein G9C98_005963 [Cotesia typhae]